MQWRQVVIIHCITFLLSSFVFSMCIKKIDVADQYCPPCIINYICVYIFYRKFIKLNIFWYLSTAIRKVNISGLAWFNSFLDFHNLQCLIYGCYYFLMLATKWNTRESRESCTGYLNQESSDNLLFSCSVFLSSVKVAATFTLPNWGYFQGVEAILY